MTNQMKFDPLHAPEPRLMADTTTELTSGEEIVSQNMTIYMLKEGEATASTSPTAADGPRARWRAPTWRR